MSKAPLGVAAIEFADLPSLAVSLGGGPLGAVVTWRPKPDPGSFTDHGRQTLFIEQGGHGSSTVLPVAVPARDAFARKR